MARRRFRWFPHTGRRHAIPDSLAIGDEGQTLCGLDIAVPREQPPRHPDGCWPTCPTCDGVWRADEGIAPFPHPRITPQEVKSRLASRRIAVRGRP